MNNFLFNNNQFCLTNLNVLIFKKPKVIGSAVFYLFNCVFTCFPSLENKLYAQDFKDETQLSLISSISYYYSKLNLFLP